jgi:cytoskeletal protein CcmA (bactofilin family)
MARNKVDKGVTLIAAHTEVVGDIKFTDQLFVSGKVTGNVLAEDEKATLIVSEEGCVAGEVRVPNIVINGTVEGDVYAGHKVELATRAKVKGNLYYKLIEMQLGALVDGQLVHEETMPEPNVHKLNLDAGQE